MDFSQEVNPPSGGSSEGRAGSRLLEDTKPTIKEPEVKDPGNSPTTTPDIKLPSPDGSPGTTSESPKEKNELEVPPPPYP